MKNTTEAQHHSDPRRNRQRLVRRIAIVALASACFQHARLTAETAVSAVAQRTSADRPNALALTIKVPSIASQKSTLEANVTARSTSITRSERTTCNPNVAADTNLKRAAPHVAPVQAVSGGAEQVRTPYARPTPKDEPFESPVRVRFAGDNSRAVSSMAASARVTPLTPAQPNQTVASSVRPKEPSARPAAGRLLLTPKLDPRGPAKFDTVATQVELLDSDLLVRDEQGRVYAVRSEAVDALLSHELLRQYQAAVEYDDEVRELESRLGQAEEALAQ